MKAFYATQYGGPEVMEHGVLPVPTPSKGQVLVRVKASSVNPVDWKVRDGQLKIASGRTFPKVLGTDFAGIVEGLGEGVSGFFIRQRVYGTTPIMFGRPGAHAEFITVRTKQIQHLPDLISFENAAALPVAALTALNGLRQCGDLDGKTVIVNGATGGVGHFAVQIARRKGAHVHAVCSAANRKRALDLGAEHVIDYKTEDFTRGSTRYDVVFDAHGHLSFGGASRALVKHGHFITTNPMPPVVLRYVWQKMIGGKHIVLGNMRGKPEDYSELEHLLSQGVDPVVEHVYSIEHVEEAFATLEKGGTVGKIVITL